MGRAVAQPTEFDDARLVVDIVMAYLDEGNVPASAVIHALDPERLRHVLGSAIGMIAHSVIHHYGPIPTEWDVYAANAYTQIAEHEAAVTTTDG